MRRHSKWNFYNILRLLQVACFLLPAIVAALTKLDPNNWPGLVGKSALWSREWVGLIVPCSAFAYGVTKSWANWFGPPWVWKAVQKLLDEYRAVAFDMQDGDPIHYHRVTLFKRERWGTCLRISTYWRAGWRRWPLSGWLIPVARSGHTTQQSKTIFLVPDDADNAEGIGGQVWASDQVIIVNDLPNVNQDSSPENINEYARKTFVSEKWVRDRIGKKPLSLALCGIPLEVNGDRWGVIVLDSMRPGAIRKTSQAWGHYQKLIPIFLGHLLARRA
jgi:hypothetical protein